MQCINCNKEINETNRFCTSCGALNPNHPANADLVSKITDNANIQNKSSVVDSNVMNNVPLQNNIEVFDASINNNASEITPQNVSAQNTQKSNFNNLTILGIVNFIIYIIFLLTFSFVLKNSFSSGFLIASIFSFYLICAQLILMKANLPWWGIFIPFYNTYLFSKLIFDNSILLYFSLFLFLLYGPLVWFGSLITLKIPIFIYILRLLVKATYLITSLLPLVSLFFLGKRFNRSGILTVLFGFIIIPSIALSNKYNYN